MKSILARRIADARLALETIECTAGRPEAASHAKSSAEWLELIARQIREELAEAVRRGRRIINYTPGPYHIGYRIKSDGTKEAHSIHSESGDAICEGLTWNVNGEADAHLLAAAPELLDVAVKMLRFVELIAGHKADQDPTVIEARAAIAKAAGKETE